MKDNIAHNIKRGKAFDQDNLRLKQFVKISYIQGIKSYTTISKPNLSQQKRKDIVAQLTIQDQARLGYSKRIMDNDLFLKYDFNQFQIQQRHKKRKENIDIPVKQTFDQYEEILQTFPQETIEKSMQIDIITALNNLRMSKENKERLNKLIEEGTTRRQKFILSFNSNFTKPMTNKLSNQAVQQFVFSQINQFMTKRLQFPQALEFQDILNINEKSFYSEQKIDNLFSFIKKQKRQLKYGRYMLNKYKFCHDLPGEMLNKISNIFYRHISKFARSLMLNLQPKQNKNQYIQNKQIHFKLQNIQLPQILSIVSGRKTSQECFIELEENFQMIAQVQRADDKQRKKEEPIHYNQGTNNFQVKKEDFAQEISQIKEFIGLSLSDIQLNYMGLLSQAHKTLQKVLDQQKFVVGMNILDMGLLNKIEELKQHFIHKELQMKYQKDKDKAIRKKKLSKNRQENFKIKYLQSLNKDLLQQQKKIQLKNRKPKAKSKNITQKRLLHNKNMNNPEFLGLASKEYK